jgi:hypothetical protein
MTPAIQPTSAVNSPLAGEIYAVAALAGPVEDCGTYRAAAPVPTLPASCLLGELKIITYPRQLVGGSPDRRYLQTTFPRATVA